MTVRRLLTPSQIGSMLSFRRPALGSGARIASALTIDDLRSLAQRRTPSAVFDYVDGGADDEYTAAENRRGWGSAIFTPHSLRPVGECDTSIDLLGWTSDLPLVLAPTGYSRLMHADGEGAVATAAVTRRIPYALATVGTTTPEGVAAVAPGGDNWFQLYPTREAGLNRDLLERARSVGFRVLVITVDTAVGGRHLRDIRNGLTIPPTLTARTLFDMARFPRWWFDKLTTPPVTFAMLDKIGRSSTDVARMMFDPDLDVRSIETLIAQWRGPVLIKGILRPDDAQLMLEAGAAGIIVSNHGGRQLDRTPTTASVLPAIRDRLGSDATILVDGGIRSGQDVAAAVALGASATMVGRAYLYGLMAGGMPGVLRSIDVIADELKRTMRLVGARTIEELRHGDFVASFLAGRERATGPDREHPIQWHS